jgi:hypothetical protein
VLGTSGWAYSGGSGYYQYDYANANIATTTVVDFTPNVASGSAALLARVQPAVTATAGTATFYSQYPPTSDITGEVVITTVQ